MDTKILLENGTNELEVLEFTICGNSYGINVARLAHLPETLLDRAKDILNVKESNGNVVVSSKVIETKKEVKQLPSYVEELNKLNPLEMTPLEALTYLFELQKKVKEGNK